MGPIDPDIKVLQAEVQELREMVASLRHQLEALRSPRAPVVAPAGGHGERAATSRRDVLKLASGVAAGVAAAGALLARPEQAAATTGQPLTIGQLQTAQNITYLANGAASANGAGTALTTEQTLFWADNRQSVLDHGIGIRGDGHGVNGSGVWGHSDFNGIGLLGDGGIGAQLAGSRAALYLASAGTAPLTRSDAHKPGEIDVDTSGALWVCVAAGSPGQWRKLAGPDSAGAFHALNPVRVYDSRWPGGSKMAASATRLVSIADGHDLTTGVVNAPNVVPSGAAAIAYNLTITNTTGSGFLTIAPGTASSVTASSINWSAAGQDLANGLIVAIDTLRQVRAFSGGGGSTDFVIDIAGYFL